MTSETPSEFIGTVLEITIVVAPENIDKFFDIFRPLYASVIAEPECTFIEVVKDPASPGTIHWVESWTKGKEWLMGVQMKKEYMQPFFEAVKLLALKERRFFLFLSLSLMNLESCDMGSMEC